MHLLPYVSLTSLMNEARINDTAVYGPRAIAFHLPQFHPIPENDEWWGKGFTEWTNVVTAKPRFQGHYQPHLPADLGFYDLRLPEARAAQAELAASYGIHGFCYYHYWFNGRQVLERPVNEIWKSGEPEFPFCLCWANENWTRQWDGLKSDILLEQKYSPSDDLAHIRSLIPIFQDRRYIRILDRPLFLVYRAKQLPEPEKTTDIWRKEAERAGYEGPVPRSSGKLRRRVWRSAEYRIRFFPGVSASLVAPRERASLS